YPLGVSGCPHSGKVVVGPHAVPELPLHHWIVSIQIGLEPSGRTVRIATAYTICWWNCGSDSAGSSPSCIAMFWSSRFTGLSQTGVEPAASTSTTSKRRPTELATDDGGGPAAVRGGYYGRYLTSGHLVYIRDGKLFAVPFDRNRLEVTGQSVAVLEGLVS